MSPTAVTILIPVLDEGRMIHEAAAQVTGQDFAEPMQLLFLDGGSTDGSRAALEAIAMTDERVRVVDNPRRTKVAALNIGLEQSTGEIVVIMDAHTLYPRHYVRVAVERLRRGDVDWVSGPAVPHAIDRGSRPVAIALGSPLGVGGSRKWRVDDQGGEIDLDTGVFGGAWPRRRLEQLGGWDENWPINQDSELASRHLADGGRIVMLPALAARYVPRNSLRGLARQYFRYGRFRAQTACRHPESLRTSHLALVAIAPMLACALLPAQRLRPARWAAGLYASVTLAASVHACFPRHVRVLPELPLVFATMHIAWSVGFLAGCRSFGIPARALRTAGLRLPRGLLRRCRPGAGK